jgi:DNA polymerase-3 subunit gamma/tau
VLLIFDEILKNGFDGHHFIVGLGEHIRNVLVCKDPATVQLLETSQNIKDTYLQQAQQCPNGFLLKALGIIGRLDVNYRIAKNQRLAVELALMQISYLNNAASLDAEKKKMS